ADRLAQLPHVDPPQPLPEDGRGAGRRVPVGADDLEQGGLAGAVRTDDDPVLPGRHRPVDVDQHGHTVVVDGHAAQLHGISRRGHAVSMRQVPSRMRPSARVGFALVACASLAGCTGSHPHASAPTTTPSTAASSTTAAPTTEPTPVAPAEDDWPTYHKDPARTGNAGTGPSPNGIK